MSALGPWKSAAELTPRQANQLINEALPPGTTITNVANADIVNAASIAKGYQPPFIPGSSVIDITTTQPIQMVRVFVETPNASSQFGTWVMRAEDVAGLTPEQIASKFGLPQVPTKMTDVNIPAGTQLQVSGANGISPNKTGLVTGSNGGGGGVQFQIQVVKGQELPQGWFTNSRALK